MSPLNLPPPQIPFGCALDPDPIQTSSVRRLPTKKGKRGKKPLVAKKLAAKKLAAKKSVSEPANRGPTGPGLADSGAGFANPWK